LATVETPPEVRATAKYVRTAPRKAQLIVGEIRGLPVPQARTVLAFMRRAAARDVEDVLASAVANAEANHGLSGDDLFVTAAYVGAGPTLKRWRARARGRVGRIRKRTCHITIRLAPASTGVLAAPAKAPEPEAPRRPRERTRAPAATAAASSAGKATVAEPAEEKPKRPRRERPEGTRGAAGRAADPEPPTGEKPRRPRRAKAGADASTAEEPADKPKRARKRAESSPEGGS
jgi:large subunit ribosomal protein L22